MDLSNFINNDSQNEFSSELNTVDFNFQEIPQEEQEEVTNEIKNTVDIETEKTKQNILKDLFSYLSEGYSAENTIVGLTKKYGSTLINPKICRIIKMFENIIGNYLITCKYNDNKGNKNPAFIKYCLFCDCKDNENVTEEKEYNKFGIDGFFTDNGTNKKVISRTCRKHNLPVLSSIDDLSEADFKELAEKVAEVKQVDKQNLLDKTNDKKIIGKIRQIFSNLNTKRIEAKIDSESYKMKDANVKATVVVGNKVNDLTLSDVVKPKLNDVSVVNKDKIKSANISDVVKPKLDKVNIVKAENVKNANVSVPTNNISVSLGNKVKHIESFTIVPNKVDKIEVQNKNKKINPKIGTKNINIAVEKESKYLENISIYTKPINDFDMKEDLEITLDNTVDDNFNEQSIETKSEFDF